MQASRCKSKDLIVTSFSLAAALPAGGGLPRPMGQASSSHAGSQNVLLLGLDGSGKTSILARLLGDDPRTVLPTLGFSIRAFSFSHENQTLKVWDQGGTPAMRRYWPAYYSKAHAVAFVIDSADRRRLAEASMVLQELLDDDSLLGIPLLVLANKQDSPSAIPADEIEDLLHLGSIRDRTWNCLSCSALRGAGLVDGMRWLADGHTGDLGNGSHRPSISMRLVARLARFRGKRSASSKPPTLARGGSSARASRAGLTRPRSSRDNGNDDDNGDDDDEASAPLSPSRRAPSLRRGRSKRAAAATASDDDEPGAPAPADESTTAANRGTARTARARRQERQQAREGTKQADSSDDD